MPVEMSCVMIHEFLAKNLGFERDIVQFHLLQEEYVKDIIGTQVEESQDRVLRARSVKLGFRESEILGSAPLS